MRNPFASSTTVVEDLPDWQTDPRVVAARQREQALNGEYEALTRQVTEERRVDHGPYGGLVTALSPSHRSWDTQRKRETKHAEWQTAHRELQRIEREAQDELAELGYQRGQVFCDTKLRPAIEQLQEILQEYAQLQADVRERTSATLGDLGSLPLVASQIPEWLEGLHRRGVFGARG
jgi:hypothetical protein